MKSLFKPEKSYGERFSKTVFLYIVKKLKIDPIIEGRLLQKKLNMLLAGDDFLELKDKKIRKKKLLIANKYIKEYHDRSRKFWKIHHQYCYLRGQLRMAITAEYFVQDAVEEQKRIEKKIKRLFE